jgi:hypothetical protein
MTPSKRLLPFASPSVPPAGLLAATTRGRFAKLIKRHRNENGGAVIAIAQNAAAHPRRFSLTGKARPFLRGFDCAPAKRENGRSDDALLRNDDREVLNGTPVCGAMAVLGEHTGVTADEVRLDRAHIGNAPLFGSYASTRRYQHDPKKQTPHFHTPTKTSVGERP